MNKTCSTCNTNDYELSDIEGYKHLCLCCSAEQMNEEWEQQVDKELLIFKDRTGRALDYNEFCYYCGIDIDLELIKDLSELKDTYELEISAILEYQDKQLGLNLGDVLF